MSKGVIIAGAGRGMTFAKLIAAANPDSRQNSVQSCADWLHISSNTSTRQMNRYVSAIVDTNRENHKKIRQELNSCGLANAGVYASLEEALKAVPETEANAVMIVTPNTTHAELTELALNYNRHVFLEKPIAASWQDVVRINNAAQAHPDRVVLLGFVLRYSNFYRRVKDICDSGVLGKIVMIQANERLSHEHSTSYRRGWRRKIAATGGAMNEKCSHDLDIICWLKESQSFPVSVFSCGGQKLFEAPPGTPELCSQCKDRTCPFRMTPEKLRKAKGSFKRDAGAINQCVYHTDADVKTEQSATIIFDDGTQAVFTMLMYSGMPGRDIVIHGTSAMLTGNCEDGTVKITYYRTGEVVDRSAKKSEWHGGGDAMVLNDFFDCIDMNGLPESRLNDGINATRLALASDLSADENRLVKLSEFAL